MPRSVKGGRFVRYDEDEIYTQIKEGERDRRGNWIPTEQERADELDELREWEWGQQGVKDAG
jgi:hypothetical protein